MSAVKGSRKSGGAALVLTEQDIPRRYRELKDAIREATRQGDEEPFALAGPLHGGR